MTNLYLKGISKILACKNFWEEEKRIVWMRKYKEFCVFEWVKFCFDDIQDKRKKRFLLKMSRKPLFYKHFLMIHFLTRFLPLCKQMGYSFLVLRWSLFENQIISIVAQKSFAQCVKELWQKNIESSLNKLNFIRKVYYAKFKRNQKHLWFKPN